MLSMGFARADVLTSSIVIKFLTKVCWFGFDCLWWWCLKCETCFDKSCILFMSAFHTSQFLIPTFCLTLPTFCLTLPNSVRDEKFGIRFIRCIFLYVPTQILIRVYDKLQTHSVQPQGVLIVFFQLNLNHLRFLRLV